MIVFLTWLVKYCWNAGTIIQLIQYIKITISVMQNLRKVLIFFWNNSLLQGFFNFIFLKYQLHNKVAILNT